MSFGTAWPEQPLRTKKWIVHDPWRKKGREKIKAIAKNMKKMNICFDKVLTSPLLRAKESAEIINSYCGCAKQVIITDLLLPNSSYQKLNKFLNELKKAKIVAIVGHEPFLSGFASFCLAHSKNSFIHLKKGGVIKIEVDHVLKPENCTLAWLLEPKHII